MTGRTFPPAAAVALVAVAAVALFVAAATLGTRDGAYAPNNWSFSHVYLADLAIRSGEVPMNWRLLQENEFAATRDEFSAATGLVRLTPYATTMWHFWNGIPLHPSLVATLSVLSGLPPESTVRVPLAGAVGALLAYATARLALERMPGVDPRLAAVAPFAWAIASVPLLLELRVLLPSTTVLLVQLLLHAMVRRGLLGDRAALPLAIAPVVLLPFWYYTVAYFLIVAFLTFGLFAAAARLLRVRVPEGALVPWWAVVAVPLALSLALVANGALTSHWRMAASMGGPLGGVDGPADTGLDYGSFLNREPWRSALLYAGAGALFAALAVVAVRALARASRRERVDPLDAVVAQWAACAVLFSLVLATLMNVSFLNRTVIYLTPVAVVALAVVAARHWRRRAARAAVAVAFALWLVCTPLLVMTASPRYSSADEAAYAWMEERLPPDAAVYASMEAGSVLFRAHGFDGTTAFHPSQRSLVRFWYGEDAEALVPYVGTLDYVVLRRDLLVRGFEDFSPARRPLTPEAYAKFASSSDLQLLFDNGDVRVFKSALDPSRFGPAPPPG